MRRLGWRPRASASPRPERHLVKEMEIHRVLLPYPGAFVPSPLAAASRAERRNGFTATGRSQLKASSASAVGIGHEESDVFFGAVVLCDGTPSTNYPCRAQFTQIQACYERLPEDFCSSIFWRPDHQPDVLRILLFRPLPQFGFPTGSNNLSRAVVVFDEGRAG